MENIRIVSKPSDERHFREKFRKHIRRNHQTMTTQRRQNTHTQKTQDKDRM